MADKFNPQYVWFIVALKSRRRLNTHLTHRQLHNEDIRNLEDEYMHTMRQQHAT